MTELSELTALELLSIVTSGELSDDARAACEELGARIEEAISKEDE